MAISLSHGGPTMYASATPADEVLVGTAKGVVTLKRDGAGWRVAKDALLETHISAILIDDETGTIFAGGYRDGGLQASEDGGVTWQRRDNGISESNVYSIAMRGRRLYVGTEPAKLFVSDDLGRSWSERPGLRKIESIDSWTFPAPPHVAHLKHITFHPSEPATMYASIEQGALLKSEDDGTTWRKVEGMDDDLHRLVINPAQTDRFFVSGGNGLYSSENGGQSWEHATDRDHEIGGYPDQLVVSSSNPQLMFVSAAHHNPGSWRESHFAGGRISRSTDAGRSWQVLGGGLPDRMQGNVEAMCLEDHGGGVCSLFAATTSGEVWLSEDSGDTWSLAITDLAPISKAGHYRNLVATPA